MVTQACGRASLRNRPVVGYFQFCGNLLSGASISYCTFLRSSSTCCWICAIRLSWTSSSRSMTSMCSRTVVSSFWRSAVPCGPVWPVGPIEPLAPGFPCGPRGPAGPGAPAGPRSPRDLFPLLFAFFHMLVPPLLPTLLFWILRLQVAPPDPTHPKADPLPLRPTPD